MKITTNLKAAVFVAALIIPAIGEAGDVSKCERIAVRVREDVEKTPQKVLVIVEDFMVSNESCACEIVKAAITASHATPDMVKQIVLTATNVAPKYANVIAECAGAVAPGAVAAGAPVASVGGKNAVSVQPGSDEGVQPVSGPGGLGAGKGTVSEPMDRGEGGTGADYRTAPYDIRGVYLIQPSTGGIATVSSPGGSTGSSVTVTSKRRAPRHSVPQSPSVAQGP
jgi:hypothetical protein